MDIQQLRYFCTVARNKSINDSAAELYVTRSALSKSVKQLEVELGYPLFVRTHTGVELTQAAMRFVVRASELVDDYDRLKSDMLGEGDVCAISCWLPNSWVECLSPRIEAAARRCAGRLRVKLGSASDAECIRRVTAGDAHMTVTHLAVDGAIDEGLEVFRSPLYIAVGEETPLARLPEIHPEDLRRETCIYYSCGFDDVFWVPRTRCASERFDNDLMHIYSAVARGEGFLPTPLHTIPAYRRGVACLKFASPDDTDIVLRCHIAASTQTDPALLKACRALRDVLARAWAAERREKPSPRA